MGFDCASAECRELSDTILNSTCLSINQRDLPILIWGFGGKEKGHFKVHPSVQTSSLENKIYLF